MKIRLLLALLASVLTATACGDSITAPTPEHLLATFQSSDTTTTDGPGWGSGTSQ